MIFFYQGNQEPHPCSTLPSALTFIRWPVTRIQMNASVAPGCMNRRLLANTFVCHMLMPSLNLVARALCRMYSAELMIDCRLDK